MKQPSSSEKSEKQKDLLGQPPVSKASIKIDDQHIPTTKAESIIKSQATNPPFDDGALKFWSSLEECKSESTIRLNLDIPISLNVKLVQSAQRLNMTKAELVRRLIEWAFKDT